MSFFKLGEGSFEWPKNKVNQWLHHIYEIWCSAMCMLLAVHCSMISNAWVLDPSSMSTTHFLPLLEAKFL